MVRLILVGLVLVLAGCASTPPGPGGTSGPAGRAPGDGRDLPAPEPVIPRPGEVAAPEPAEPVSRPDPSVSLALRTESARAAASGNTGRAVDLLERAIRIEPGRAELWFDLAELYLDEGDPLRARQLADKGTSLIGDDRALQRRARALHRRIDAASAAG